LFASVILDKVKRCKELNGTTLARLYAIGRSRASEQKAPGLRHQGEVRFYVSGRLERHHWVVGVEVEIVPPPDCTKTFDAGFTSVTVYVVALPVAL
jgi:hypothetical protein